MHSCGALLVVLPMSCEPDPSLSREDLVFDAGVRLQPYGHRGATGTGLRWH